MSTLLLKNAALLITMDEKRRQIEQGGLFVRDNVIKMVGPSNELPQEADRVIDASGMVALPGLVNTHHHLYQTLTRALPSVQDVELFDWLVTLYPIWAELTAEAVYVSAQIGLAELMLSGCTTANDHLYIYPNDVTLDAEIRAAQELGIRFHPCRGSMSLGKSKGGLGRDDIGSLSPGKAADFIAINLDRPEYAGAGHDPLGALLFCQPMNVDLSVINGRAVVEKGHIVGFDLKRAIAYQNEISQEMLKRATAST